MFDPKSLLNDLLGSQIPGTGTTVRDTAGKATQLAKDNALAAGALVAVLRAPGRWGRAQAWRHRGNRWARLQGLPELQERR